MTPHPQAKWIKAKADGHTIQQQQPFDSAWEDMGTDDFLFSAYRKYRIKPAAPVVERIVSHMTPVEISHAWTGPAGVRVADLSEFANAALRHAIDSQQVIRMAEVQEIASQLGKDKRAARDMAVAEAVHCVCKSFVFRCDEFLDLRAIIAGVK